MKSEGFFVVSYFGNIGTCQDIDTIITAIRKLKNEKIKFMFAGHGNKLGDLKKIAFDEKLDNVIICNFLFFV
jgi:glycosyltransferase involved in cell wall biosynthesis